jgi:ribosomal protein S18 acetylase RimI-like enzyme
MSTEYETTVDATVRTATEDDAEAIMSLWNGYAETLADYDERFTIEDGGREKWQSYFTNSLVESSRGDILLAEVDGEIVGALEARIIGGHPVFNFGKHGQVYGHYVDESMRGRGVGRALLEAAEEWFQEREMPFWRVDVLHGIEEEALYDSVGMRPMEVTYEKEL